MKLTPLHVYVSHSDCSNRGVSSKEDTLYLVDEQFGKEMKGKIPPEAIFRMEDCGEGYIRLIPVNNTKPDLCGPMCGGNVATLARYSMVPRNHPLQGKFMHIHDRFETWEQNRLLSI